MVLYVLYSGIYFPTSSVPKSATRTRLRQEFPVLGGASDAVPQAFVPSISVIMRASYKEYTIWVPITGFLFGVL